ncbi:MAG TPA: hypothetical protein VGB30_08040 [bacterium]|jgi:hypothetical protein
MNELTLTKQLIYAAMLVGFMAVMFAIGTALMGKSLDNDTSASQDLARPKSKSEQVNSEDGDQGMVNVLHAHYENLQDWM